MQFTVRSQNDLNTKFDVPFYLLPLSPSPYQLFKAYRTPQIPATSIFSIAFNLHVSVSLSSRTLPTLFPLQDSTIHFINNENVHNGLTQAGLPHLKDLRIMPKLESFTSEYMLKIIEAILPEGPEGQIAVFKRIRDRFEMRAYRKA